MPTAFMIMGCSKRIYLSSFLLIILYLNCVDSNGTAFICPTQCLCKNTSCGQEDGISCTPGLGLSCLNLDEDLESIFQHGIKSLTIVQHLNSTQLSSLFSANLNSLMYLSLRLAPNFHLDLDNNTKPIGVLHLNISHNSLQSVPGFIKIFSGLKHLDLCYNSLQGDVKMLLDMNHLETLDLSSNSIKTFSLKGNLKKLHTLLLNDNQLHRIPDLTTLTGLKVLDISNNEFALNSSNTGQKSLQDRVNNCIEAFPASISSLYMRNLFLWKVPAKDCGLWSNLENLEHLFLEDNVIIDFADDIFPERIYDTLQTLMLDNNKIKYISPNSLNRFKSLKLLSLTNNNLGHIPMQVFEDGVSVSIHVGNNKFSCDCMWKDFLMFLENNSSKVSVPEDFVCYYPQSLRGNKLSDLYVEDLYCFDISLKPVINVSCHEYQDCAISCVFDGLPHPQTTWISPSGEHISEETLAYDASFQELYGLSSDGHKLTIFNLDYYRTGVYTCIGNNSNSWSSGKVQVGVILAPLGSIVAIVVSAVSFLIAIVLNSVNLCYYYCEHLSQKRAKREADAQMSLKMESPLKSKKKGLYESEASLNANKYYRKYDFTCQQVFLDTVIKGAHTVKRTLYDAKNSDFSNNVWEYASHLRDRLHIELPTTVQLPRVSMPSISMPSISMPSISMPSMPNFQSINTNIEKLGTSVMHRSHNLATSVGSVLTLRWLRSGNSDNESDSDYDAAGFSEVRVHVHKSQDAMSKQDFSTTSENPAEQEVTDGSTQGNESLTGSNEKKNSLQRKNVRFVVKNDTNIADQELAEGACSITEPEKNSLIPGNASIATNSDQASKGLISDSFQFETTV